MLQRIVALAMVCLIGIGGVQVWVERSVQEKQFFNTMALIVETSSRAIGHALWDIDRERLNNHLQRLTEIEAVGAVHIQVALTGEILTAGRSKAVLDAPSYEAVIHSPDDKEQVLGTIEVWADPDFHRNLLWESQKHVIPGYLIFTALMCIMVAWVIRRDLGLPLRQIADFVRHLRPEAVSQPLQIQRARHERCDEIDLVVQGFHHLQEELDRHIRQLDGLVKERTQELSELVEEVKRLSQVDVLTGAYNRRAMEQRLPLELDQCMSEGRAFSIIFTDIDHFKRINDRHGHAVGDAVLRAIAQRLQHALRAGQDWMVRFGGEEFVICLPDTALDQASEVAQRLAQVVRGEPWQGDGLQLQLTCSFGVTQRRNGESMEALLQRVDGLLYQAKHQGRDSVCSEA